MRKFDKIVSRFLVIITILVFAISTTGFTLYTHNCSHHNLTSTVISPDNCCDDVDEEIPIEAHGCCASETTSNTCGSNYQESSCCETDLNYFRLSEWYLEPQSEKNIECPKADFEIKGFEQETGEVSSPDFIQTGQVYKKPKIPIYRLYQQVKLDPPLI